MKIKLDENIPAQLTEILTTLGHDADTVADEKLTGQLDPLRSVGESEPSRAT